MFKLHADKVKLDCTQKELVTSGSVGINECQFTFGPEWDDMDKVIVFRAGSVKVSIALDISNTCKIPWEVLEKKDQTLEVGVYGTRGGDVALPTVWATLGTVREGATVGDTAQPPTPDIYETILEAASSAMRTAQSVRDDADAGAFDGEAATIEVGETITGEPNTPAKVENIGTKKEAVFRFTLPGGLTGPTGATPQISVEVNGLPEESEPTVQVSGTPEHPIITLGIPAGKTGATGDPGSPGTPGQTPNIEIGTIETLPAGSDVTASISGQTPNLVLNLGIPQGRQGDPGQAATVTVGTTTTGAPGSQASVVNSGTPNAAVLDFTIPAGETGAGLPPTDTAQVGDVPTWDGQQVVWEPPVSGGGGWTSVGTQTMDGVESAVAFSCNLNGGMIVVTVVGTKEAMVATKATISITHKSGRYLSFYAQTLKSTQYIPKNVFIIFGGSRNRAMLFIKGEYGAYSGSVGSAIEQEYGNNLAGSEAIDPVETVTVTFDAPPVAGTLVYVEGM